MTSNRLELEHGMKVRALRQVPHLKERVGTLIHEIVSHFTVVEFKDGEKILASGSSTASATRVWRC